MTELTKTWKKYTLQCRACTSTHPSQTLQHDALCLQPQAWG